MKILHYSDAGSPDFLKLYSEADILITTGDLSLFDFAGLENISPEIPSFGVYGNHDTRGYLEQLNILNLHNKIVEFNGLKLGGFQGCLQYKETSEFQFSENEAKVFADTFPYVDILLLHVGPKGMLDAPDPVHQGSEHIRRYVLEKQPKFIFVGHEHSTANLQVGPTKIYRTFRTSLLTI
ncbi:MAG: metallophosphoesterase [Candidatus Shapirobacteria bacterium]|nr:metallophosphoesterase [Candidatus Shapirobacteria bacterium]